MYVLSDLRELGTDEDTKWSFEGSPASAFSLNG